MPNIYPALQVRTPDIAGAFYTGQNNMMRNKLLQQTMAQQQDEQARSAQSRALLADYAAPGGTPEEKATNLQKLMAVDPNAAYRAQAAGQQNTLFQQGQEQVQDTRRQKEAMQKYLDAQYTLNSKNPAMALELTDKDGALRQKLHEAGYINMDDGISDDEARTIAQWVMQMVGPIAGIGPEGMQGNAPAALQTFNALTAGLSPEQQEKARLIELGLSPRAGSYRVTDVNGVPTLTGASDNGQPVAIPLSSLDSEIGASTRKKEADTLAGTKGKTTGQRWATQIDDGFAAADAIPVLNRGLELLQSGVETGGWDRVKLAASNAFGVTGADEGELSANLGKAVLSQLRQTFGSQFTEREGARLEGIEAGFGKSTAANIRLLEQAKQIMERAARRGINAAKASGDPETAQLIEDAMQFQLSYDSESPAAPASAPPPVGAAPTQQAVDLTKLSDEELMRLANGG